MSDSENGAKVNLSNRRDLFIQAGMQSIPYIGSQLATLIFGIKQERRLKRLETFFREFAEKVEDIKDRIAPLEAHDKEALAAIFEELTEKVEREHSKEKREFLKTYFKNTLINPVKGNYDERRFFLDALGSMTLLECEVLGYLYNQTEPVRVGAIEKPGVDQYAIVGAVGRLKAYGFLEARSFSIGAGEDNLLNEQVNVSAFGRRFCEFCLKAD